jgi:hypothetical protein
LQTSRAGYSALHSRSIAERVIEEPAALGEIVEHGLQLAHMWVREAGDSARDDGRRHESFLRGAGRAGAILDIDLLGTFVGRAVRRHARGLRRSGLPDILHETLALLA